MRTTLLFLLSFLSASLWPAAFGAVGLVPQSAGNASLLPNQYTTNVSGTPVIGSFWFQGTNGAPVTNNARVALEWIPVMRSLRIGELGANASGPDVFDSTTAPSNYWHETNIGFGSVAFGSNVMVKGRYSSVLNGIYNIVNSNVCSTIVGGSNNIIYTNAHYSFIGSGNDNAIYMSSENSFIGGGGNNIIRSPDYGTIAGGFANIIERTTVESEYAFIGGGRNNSIGETGGSDASSDAVLCGGNQNLARGIGSFIGGGNANTLLANDNDYSLIVGGQNNTIGVAASELESKYAAIVGGSQNDIDNGCTYTFIGGGLINVIASANTNSFIGGGFNNRIESGAPAASILAGLNNSIGTSGDFGTVFGGVSNSVDATYATAGGNFITNTTASSFEAGHGANGGNNRKLRVDVNGVRVMTYNGSATVGGTYLITNTPIASAGAVETNLQMVTIGAHVLTNNNDRLLVRASGRFAATSNTKQVQLVFGSEDVFDSGAFVANTGAWTLDAEIIRTGNTSQSVNCSFNGGTNVVYVRTSSLDLAQTNGIATVLKITGTAAGNGDITNRTLTVEWRPST